MLVDSAICSGDANSNGFRCLIMSFLVCELTESIDNENFWVPVTNLVEIRGMAFLFKASRGLLSRLFLAVIRRRTSQVLSDERSSME